MGIEALLEGFSEKIEAVKTKLQGEVIWTHVHNSACICVCWSKVQHTVCTVQCIEKKTLVTRKLVAHIIGYR